MLALTIKGMRTAAVAGLVLAAGPVLGAGAGLAMLDQLTPGTWELGDRSGAIAQRVCVPHGRRLLQLRHPGAACDTYVIEDQPSEVVAQYTCRGRGYGRTHIRRETNRLVQIDGNGIADGLPFEFAYEARRVGDC